MVCKVSEKINMEKSFKNSFNPSSLLAKHIPSGGGIRWTPPQDFCYALTDQLEIWHEY